MKVRKRCSRNNFNCLIVVMRLLEEPRETLWENVTEFLFVFAFKHYLLTSRQIGINFHYFKSFGSIYG